MARKKSRIRILATRSKVEESLVVEGLEGQVEINHLVEPDLLGATHRLLYRNRLGRRLEFKFESTLQSVEQSYSKALETSPKDTVTKRRWIHLGETRTGSRAFSSACALISADGSEINGEVKVRYQVSGPAPFGRIYSGTQLVPLK